MFKLGDRKKLLSPKLGFYILKEIIENPEIELDYDCVVAECSNCGTKIKKNEKYILTKVYVFKKEDDGMISLKGESITPEGSKKLIRFPDMVYFPDKKKTIEDKVKLKSKYLKEK